MTRQRICAQLPTQKQMHSNTRKLRTKPWIFYWSYYTLFRGSNISSPVFFYWLLKWRNYSPPCFTYDQVRTYFQCYGRSNDFIIFTLKELYWTYFLSHVVSKIPIVTSPCIIVTTITLNHFHQFTATNTTLSMWYSGVSESVCH